MKKTADKLEEARLSAVCAHRLIEALISHPYEKRIHLELCNQFYRISR